MQTLYFEDFYVGWKIDAGSYTLSEEEMTEFARRYVPMPYHTGAEEASHTAFGALVAPGHLTAAIVFGLFAKTGATLHSAMGSPGMDVRWLKPVRPGDTLTVTVEVTRLSPARRPGVWLHLSAVNQRGDAVMAYDTLQFVKRRPPP